LLAHYTINQTHDPPLLAALGVQPTDLSLSFWNGTADLSLLMSSLCAGNNIMAATVDLAVRRLLASG
jgi:hypothetical protein